MIIDINFTIDLNKGVIQQHLNQPFYCAEQNAHRINVKLVRGNEPVDLEEFECHAYITSKNLDVTYGPIDCDIDENVCSVIIPADAYSIAGPIQIVMNLVHDDSVATILSAHGNIVTSMGGTIIDVTDSVVPNLDLLEERITAAQQLVTTITTQINGVKILDPFQMAFEKYLLGFSNSTTTISGNTLWYHPATGNGTAGNRFFKVVGEFEASQINSTLGNYTPPIGELIPIDILGKREFNIRFFSSIPNIENDSRERKFGIGIFFCHLDTDGETVIKDSNPAYFRNDCNKIQETTVTAPDNSTLFSIVFVFTNGYAGVGHEYKGCFWIS